MSDKEEEWSMVEKDDKNQISLSVDKAVQIGKTHDAQTLEGNPFAKIMEMEKKKKTKEEKAPTSSKRSYKAAVMNAPLENITELPEGAKCVFSPTYGAVTYFPGKCDGPVWIGTDLSRNVIDTKEFNVYDDLGKWKLARVHRFADEDELVMIFARGFGVFHEEGTRIIAYPDRSGSIYSSTGARGFDAADIVMELFGPPPPTPFCSAKQIKEYSINDPYGIGNLYWDLDTSKAEILSPEMRKRWEDYYDERVLGRKNTTK